MGSYAIYEERFFGRIKQARVDDPLSCWVWQRGKHTAGYGSFEGPGCGGYAHRFAWQHFNGPVPEGLDLDHLCENKSCVNPWHLEPVTRGVNAYRASGWTATHCPAQHDQARYGTQVASHGGAIRRCKECVRLRQRAARRAAGAPFMPGRMVRDGDV